MKEARSHLMLSCFCHVSVLFLCACCMDSASSSLIYYVTRPGRNCVHFCKVFDTQQNPCLRLVRMSSSHTHPQHWLDALHTEVLVPHVAVVRVLGQYMGVAHVCLVWVVLCWYPLPATSL